MKTRIDYPTNICVQGYNTYNNFYHNKEIRKNNETKKYI